MLSGILIAGFTTCYLAALGLELEGLEKHRPPRRLPLLAVLITGLLIHAIYVGSLVWETNTPSFSTPGEFFLLVAWILAFLYLAAACYMPRVPIGLWMSPFIISVPIGLMFETESAKPLIVERTFVAWSAAHGLFLLFGTVSVCIGFLAGLMYLVQSYALKHVRSDFNRLRLPSLEWLEKVNSRTLAFSAVMIGLGFVTGIILAVAMHEKEASYHLWSDPVVLSLAAMLAWLVGAEIFRLVYPAARRGRKVAYLTLASFVFLVIAIASLMLLDNVHGNRQAQMPNQQADRS